MTQLHVSPFFQTRLKNNQQPKFQKEKPPSSSPSLYEKQKQKENQAIPKSHLQT